MAYEELGKPRYKKEYSGHGIVFTIPSRKNWFLILFLGFWLIGWAFGEISVSGILLGGFIASIMKGAPPNIEFSFQAFGGLFLVVWLAGWTAGGAFAIYTWLWQIKGREIISISPDRLKYETKIPLWVRSKEYNLEHVKSLRITKENPSFWNGSRKMDFWGITGGSLAFDYGAKTVKFGMNIDEAEAKLILNDILQYYPGIAMEQ